jgi:hypothetical protein
MLVDLTAYFRVFHEGAAVHIVCYQAASELPGGMLRGWFQPEPGYELEVRSIVSVWTPVLRDGKPVGQASATAIVDNNGGGLQWEAARFDWDLP